MWLAKTCHVPPTIENFGRVSCVHCQPKTIMICCSDDELTEVEPKYRCYTFAF